MRSADGGSVTIQPEAFLLKSWVGSPLRGNGKPVSALLCERLENGFHLQIKTIQNLLARCLTVE